MAGTTRLELATSAVTGQRSNQLNYVPSLFSSGLGETRRFTPLVARTTTRSICPCSVNLMITDRSETVSFGSLRKTLERKAPDQVASGPHEQILPLKMQNQRYCSLAAFSHG